MLSLRYGCKHDDLSSLPPCLALSPLLFFYMFARVSSSYFLLRVRAVVAHRVVVAIRLPQAWTLPVDSMAGAGRREGGEGVLWTAGGDGVRRASWTVLSQGRPFVVTPLCVHPVKTVKQPIDLCLYQRQLLFNHLQLLHPQLG